MNSHALDVLQLPEMLKLVSAHAATTLGGEAIRDLRPSTAVERIEAELRRVEQMTNLLLRMEEEWAVPALPDIRSAIRRLEVEGSAWEGPEFSAAAELIRSGRQTRRSILRYGEDYPALTELAAGVTKLEEEEKAIRHAVDERGEVRDRASSELRRIRGEIRGSRARVVEQLEKFVAGLSDRVRVENASVTVREGRYVIPIRREGKSRVGGIVHDESASGNTLFVEPQVAIDLMNRLRELELAEKREVQRILRELTGRLRPHAEELRTNLAILIELDSLYGRARYALTCDGRRPAMDTAGEADYSVVGGAHPLLLAGSQPVVPFDLAFEPGERTLLVSGPNTGGKTVLLKAIGSISILAQSGVIPPVKTGTRLPVFRDVFADIGDEQSIEASLSTFSAHLANLRDILEGADPHTLVLIDEIGSGTDPREGAALAESILVDLTRRGALTVATSHLGQLKLLAGEEPGVVNASLQFDSRELRPTYRLTKGVPGRSYGLAIARRLGFPDEIVARAEELLPREERQASRLLKELEEKERAAGRDRAGARADQRRAREMVEKLEERERKLREREKDAERRARQQARDLLLRAREEVEEAIQAFRSRAEDMIGPAPEVRTDGAANGSGASLEELATEARRAVEEAAGRQLEKAPPEPEPEPTPEEVALQTGDRVRLLSTGATGHVVELRDGRAVVEAGGLRLQVPSGELETIPEEDESPKSKSETSSTSGWSEPTTAASTEVDLRGLRAEEAESRLVPALDAAMIADLPTLTIIHGKGTGVLREVVQEFLAGEPRIANFRPGEIGEGGSGVTVVEFE